MDDSLVKAFFESLKKQNLTLRDGDILLIVSKVVALTEGRLVKLSGKKLSGKKRYGAYRDSADFSKLVKQEADIFFNDEMFLSVKNGIFTPSAGIDTSNIPDGYALGWPKNSYGSAALLRKKILQSLGASSIKNFGVEIFDSFIVPLRQGVTGISLGYSGFRGIEDCRGKKDLYGKPLRVTYRNIADSLAAAATLVCGEAGESIPFVLVRTVAPSAVPGKAATRASTGITAIGGIAGIKWTSAKISTQEIRRNPRDCLYRTLYSRGQARSLAHS